MSMSSLVAATPMDDHVVYTVMGTGPPKINGVRVDRNQTKYRSRPYQTNYTVTGKIRVIEAVLL